MGAKGKGDQFRDQAIVYSVQVGGVDAGDDVKVGNNEEGEL